MYELLVYLETLTDRNWICFTNWFEDLKKKLISYTDKCNLELYIHKRPMGFFTHIVMGSWNACTNLYTHIYCSLKDFWKWPEK